MARRARGRGRVARHARRLALRRPAPRSVVGHGLEHRDNATTVRVRDGQTLLTDGPFAETKEFLAGIAVLNTPSEQEAIELAAKFPLARFHMVEVRPFWGG